MDEGKKYFVSDVSYDIMVKIMLEMKQLRRHLQES